MIVSYLSFTCPSKPAHHLTITSRYSCTRC